MKLSSRGRPVPLSAPTAARVAEIEALAAAGSAEAVEPLIEALRDAEGNVQEAAVRALVQLGPEHVIARLSGQPKSASQWKPIARVLGLLGTQESCELLGAALHDANEAIRVTASLALVDAGEASVPVLIEALTHQATSVRARAAMSLGRIKAKAAVESLTAACRDGSPEVRLEAVLALAATADERAVPALVEAVLDEAEAVRQAVPIALGEIGTEAAREGLSACLASDDEMVRFIAESELADVSQ